MKEGAMVSKLHSNLKKLPIPELFIHRPPWGPLGAVDDKEGALPPLVLHAWEGPCSPSEFSEDLHLAGVLPASAAMRSAAGGTTSGISSCELACYGRTGLPPL
ncbi:hypothetical protein KSP40_PGU000266 [Platanthera guangdongensis]|uniref:Uncharacterized protein n=1 Tax=Platanthera guangdongensis TaxID=2320717 RepID=A0ABR2N076_9ASPA